MDRFEQEEAAIIDPRRYDCELPPVMMRERRLHALAANRWHSLRSGRHCPRLSDLRPSDLMALSSGGMLVELARGEMPPKLLFLGRELAAEAGIAIDTPGINDAPRASLLAQLIRRLPKVRDQRGPVAFEADYPARDGLPLNYRGVLLPYADECDEIAFVHGVISWTAIARDGIGPDIVAAVGAAMSVTRAARKPSVWQHDPSTTGAPAWKLRDRLAAARTWAALGGADHALRHASLRAALEAAHDLLIAGDSAPEAFVALAADAGLAHGSAIALAIGLVFGPSTPRRMRVRHAAVIAHARRLGLGPGLLADLLERTPGGEFAMIEAEWRARRAVRAGHSTAAIAPAPGRQISFVPFDPDLYRRQAGWDAGRSRQMADVVTPFGRIAR